MTEIGGLCGLLSRRRRQPSGGGAHAEAVFADLCTLLRPHGPSRDRVGHESHDVDGPLALVIPGCSDLRPTPPGR